MMEAEEGEEVVTCAFCGGSESGSVDTGGVLIDIGKNLVVHELCAYFSSGIDIDDQFIPEEYSLGSLVSVLQEVDIDLRCDVRHGRKLRCALCQEPGANIDCCSCLFGKKHCFHYPCAQRAGLVEWFQWPDGKRIVHCVEHLAPRCTLYRSSDKGQSHGYCSVGIVDGPKGGRYRAIHFDPPYSQKMLVPAHSDICIRKPATGAGRWSAFGALCTSASIDSVLREENRIIESSSAPSTKRKKVRCIIGGRPLEAFGRENYEVVPETASARPLAWRASDRRIGALAVQASRAIQRRLTSMPRRSHTCMSPVIRSSTALDFEITWSFLEPKEVRFLNEVCGALRNVVNGAEGTGVFARDLLNRYPTIALKRFLHYAFPSHDNPTLAAWRWLSLNNLRWPDHSPAGPDLHFGADSAVGKGNCQTGDVTVGCIYRDFDDDLWINSRLCFCMHFEFTLPLPMPAELIFAVGLSLPLAAPSPFWLGTEPAGCGFGLALDARFRFSAPGIPPSPLLFSCLPDDRVLEGTDQIGIILDRHTNPQEPILAFYLNGSFIGIAPTIGGPLKSSFFNNLKAALTDPGLRPAVGLLHHTNYVVVVSPAFPIFDNEAHKTTTANRNNDLPFGLPRSLRSVRPQTKSCLRSRIEERIISLNDELP